MLTQPHLVAQLGSDIVAGDWSTGKVVMQKRSDAKTYHTRDS
jgi:hypothetical protein